MLNITSGKVVRAQKITIYGAEGIGKTTLAAAFPDPLFIDTEGGTSHMDVRRIETPTNWDSLVAVVNEVADNPKICGTLVLDTADWAEQLAVDSICAKYKKAGIEDFGYGKGYTYLGEEFSRLLAAFDRVIRFSIHVVITAHAKMRKFEQPDEMGAYDRWEMKLSKQVAPLLKEWCDMLLFCNYQTYVIHGDNPMEKSKVQGGKRVMYTSHHPCWDAKNRHGLQECLPLDYKAIAHIFRASTPQRNTPAVSPLVEVVRANMTDSGITEEQLRKVVAAKSKYSESTPIDQYPESFLSGWVLKYWNQIVNTIQTDTSATNDGGNNNAE